MKNINSLLAQLAEGSTHIISNQNTINILQAQGVEFKSSHKTEKEFIDDIFSQRKQIALSTISKFPAPPDIAIPTIGFLYDEIRECILLGLYGSAISLCAILVEFSLKQAIVRKIHGDKYNKKEWDRIERIELSPTISEAKKLKIIDDKLEASLISFKNSIRNPYLHYNIKKITKNVAANKVKKVNVVTQKVEELNISAEDNPILWGLAKKFVDRDTVFDIFIFTDRVIKDLFEEKA